MLNLLENITGLIFAYFSLISLWIWYEFRLYWGDQQLFCCRYYSIEFQLLLGLKENLNDLGIDRELPGQPTGHTVLTLMISSLSITANRWIFLQQSKGRFHNMALLFSKQTTSTVNRLINRLIFTRCWI